jgi:hypothetical protein
VAPILARVEVLRQDRAARRALAARSLAGALGGLPQLTEAVADDLDHQAIDAGATARSVNSAFDAALGDVRGQLRRGTFLRAETLRNWQAFVGADQVTRLFATGIGRIRGAVAEVVHGPAIAPVALVRDATVSDIVTLARTEVASASRRSALAWAADPLLGARLAHDPGLWSESADFDARLSARLEDWQASIAADVRATGSQKRTLARGASTGVNAIGIAVMLATFAHTGGLTGAEIGVAAATGFLNQKLLSALFGEAAMVEMIQRAGARLDDALGLSVDGERQRFLALLPDAGDLRQVALDLRSISAEMHVVSQRATVAEPGR